MMIIIMSVGQERMRSVHSLSSKGSPQSGGRKWKPAYSLACSEDVFVGLESWILNNPSFACYGRHLEWGNAQRAGTSQKRSQGRGWSAERLAPTRYPLRIQDDGIKTIEFLERSDAKLRLHYRLLKPSFVSFRKSPPPNPPRDFSYYSIYLSFLAI